VSVTLCKVAFFLSIPPLPYPYPGAQVLGGVATLSSLRSELHYILNYIYTWEEVVP